MGHYAVPDAGGYPGSPYFKITVAGTNRALAATADAELVVVPAFTAAPEQLWRIEQFPDGTWRIVAKSTSNSKQALAISAVGSSLPTLAGLDARSEKQRWVIKNQ
jgi:arabinan endo-1,5-alpha-L-arabinosidase